MGKPILRFFRNTRESHLPSMGFSLLEMLVGLAIFSVVLFAGFSLTRQLDSQLAQVRKKLELLQDQQVASMILSKKSTCDCQLQNLTFDASSTNPQVSLSKLKLNCTPGDEQLLFRTLGVDSNSGALVNSMQLINIQTTGNSNEFLADFKINPNTKDALIFKPPTIPVRIYTDPDSLSSDKKILSCGAAPLTTPSELTAVSGNGQCAVQWTPSAGGNPITYTLRKSLSAGGSLSPSTGSISCTTLNNFCLVGGLINGTSYYFSVSASNPYEGPMFSNEITCTPSIQPSVPVLKVLPYAGTNCQVTWTPSTGTGPTTYEVRYSTTPSGASSGTTICSTNSTSCSITGLTTGQTYYLAAKSMNSSSSSAFSNEEICVPSVIQYTYSFDWSDFNGVNYSKTFAAPLGYTKVRMVSISKPFPDGTSLDTTSQISIPNSFTYWNNTCSTGNYFKLDFRSNQTVRFSVKAESSCFNLWSYVGGFHLYTVEYLP